MGLTPMGRYFGIAIASVILAANMVCHSYIHQEIPMTWRCVPGLSPVEQEQGVLLIYRETPARGELVFGNALCDHLISRSGTKREVFLDKARLVLRDPSWGTDASIQLLPNGQDLTIDTQHNALSTLSEHDLVEHIRRLSGRNGAILTHPNSIPK